MRGLDDSGGPDGQWSLSAVFFSSRRRHTRYWRDWSSDVCSSDLPLVAARGVARRFGARTALRPVDFEVRARDAIALVGPNGARPAERRVGKERRYRWSPYH